MNMVPIRTYERFTHYPIYALNVMDDFAAARLSRDSNDPSHPIEIPSVLGRISFFVTHRLTPPVITYDRPLEFISRLTRSGFFVFSGETRRQRQAGTGSLSPGRYRWRIESDYYQGMNFEHDWPPHKTLMEQGIKLRPGPRYPFPNLDLKQRDLGVTLLRGTIFMPNGKPVEKAKVELTLPELPSSFITYGECDTDFLGEWVLVLIERKKDEPPPDLEHSRIRVHLPDKQYDVDLHIRPGEENSVRQTALRGRTVKPGGMPASGAMITTSAGEGESIVGADGQWSFYFDLRQGDGPVTVTAKGIDGLTGSKSHQIVHGQTTTVPTIQLS
ncbi:hypothetical protein [Nitrospira sp. Nam80]